MIWLDTSGISVYYKDVPYRKTVFSNNEIYHIFNRSIAKSPIFKNTRDYNRFLDVVNFYKFKKPPIRFSFYDRLEKQMKLEFLENLTKTSPLLIEIFSFSLMPNHFHFLVKQLEDKGAIDFTRNMQNSYAKFFNTKYERTGSLFQSQFKAVRIESEEQLLHVSRYIHLNPVSSFLIKLEELERYPWTSFPDYLGKRTSPFITTSFILNNFSTPAHYKKFVLDQADYQRELEKIKHLTLES